MRPGDLRRPGRPGPRAFRSFGYGTLLAGALALGLAAAPRPARADPWLVPGDVQARTDVELLADTGVLEVPITTWPIPWGELGAALARVNPDTLSPAQQLAYQRLLAGVRAVQDAAGGWGFEAAAAPGRPALRWFGATPRGKSMAGASYSGYDGRIAYRLDVSAVYGSRDHQRVRLDGSYVSFALGSWILTAGAIDQYWGPAWSGSLVLGTDSRPVPGFSLTNYVAQPFDSPLLHWMGPWVVTFFAGDLGTDRYVPNALLLGARFAFHPLPGLEIGLTRTAQFAGDGRNHSWYCFTRMLLGKTQTTGNNTSATSPDNCANNLASFDVRFHVPHTPLAFYTQMNATDTGGKPSFAPSKWTGVFGLSGFGAIGNSGGNYRAFLEYANTTVDSWNTPHINVAYEHHVYRSGYRYRGFVLGYPTDNDSELFTAGVTLQGVDGGGMTFLLRRGTLNRDNTNGNEPYGGNKLAPRRTGLDEADVYFTPSYFGRHLTLGLGVTRWAPAGLPAETGLHALLEWQQGFTE